MAAPGCRSCESYPPAPPDQIEWVTILRFESVDAMRKWRLSEANQKLVAEAAPFAEGGFIAQIPGGAANEYYVLGGAGKVYGMAGAGKGQAAIFDNFAAKNGPDAPPSTQRKTEWDTTGKVGAATSAARPTRR